MYHFCAQRIPVINDSHTEGMLPDIKSVLWFENLPIMPSGLMHIIAGVAELEEHLTRHTV